MAKREGFLRLTGVTDLVTSSGSLDVEALGKTPGGRHQSLFGSDYVEGTAVATLAFNHIVYLRTPNRVHLDVSQDAAIKERYDAYGGEEGIHVVGRIAKRFGGKRSLVSSGKDWNSANPEARLILVTNPPYVWEHQDPHEVFFRSALAMRQKFAQNSLDTLNSLPDSYRSTATLITEVSTPISAYTREDVGFDLGCEFHQRITMEKFDPDVDLLPGQLFSTVGDYPIEMPTGIDIERLMRIDLLAAAKPHLIVENKSLIV